MINQEHRSTLLSQFVVSFFLMFRLVSCSREVGDAEKMAAKQFHDATTPPSV
jgi:hypothetical protein